MRRYLAGDVRGLRIEHDAVWVSHIFEWYAKEIVPGGRITDQRQLLSVIGPSLSRETKGRLPTKKGVKFLDYDWSLNAQAGR